MGLSVLPVFGLFGFGNGVRAFAALPIPFPNKGALYEDFREAGQNPNISWGTSPSDGMVFRPTVLFKHATFP